MTHYPFETDQRTQRKPSHPRGQNMFEQISDVINYNLRQYHEIAVIIADRRPEIDSIWKAKDGRRMRVCKITESEMDDGYWAHMFVLPPYEKHQRRRTRVSDEYFTSGFLKLESL